MDVDLRLIADNSQYISTLKESGNAYQNFNDIVKSGQEEQSKAIQDTAKSLATETNQLTNSSKNLDQSGQSIRAQLRAVREEMTRLVIAGKGNTQQFDDLAKKAGELQLQFNRTQNAIRDFSSSTGRKLEALVGIGQSMAGAYTTALGAMSLFSDGSDKAAETTQKMTSAIGLLVGIQSVMNVLNKNSETVMAVLELQRKAAIVSTNLQSAAESKNVIVRYSAIIAQKILNAVMSANPVLLLVTGMLALGAAIMFFVDKAIKASKQLELLNKVETELFDMQDARIANIKREADERLSAYQDRIKEAKAEGTSQLELMNLEIEAAKVRKQNASQISSQYNATAEQIQYLVEKIAKQREEYERLFFSPEAYKKENKAMLEQSKNQIDLNVKKLKAMLDVQKEFADADLDLDVKELEKKRLLLFQEVADRKAVLESKLAMTKEESMQEMEAKIGIMNQEMAKELLNVDLTEKQAQAIKDKYLREEIDIRKAFRQKMNSDDLSTISAIASAEVAATIEGTKENHEAKLKQIEADYKANKYGIEISIKDEVLKLAKLEELNANYLAAKRDQNKAFALQELDFQNSQLKGQEDLSIIKNQEIIASNKYNISAILKAKDDIDAINQAAIDRELALNDEKYSKGLITEEEYQTKLTELTTEGEKLRLSKITRTAQEEQRIKEFTKQAILDMVSSIMDAQIAEAEQNISLIDKKLDAANKYLDEQKKLQDEGMANNVNTAKKEIAQLNEQKRQALEQEKKIKKEQIMIDTATQTSKLILSGVELFESQASKGIAGVIIAAGLIAAMYGIIASARAKAKALEQETQMAEGGYIDEYGVVKGKKHFQGGERLLNHISVEKGEGIGVFNSQATALYGDMLPKWVASINSMQMPRFDSFRPNMTQSNTYNLDSKKMEKKLDSINDGIRVLNDNLMNQENTQYKNRIKVQKLSKNHTRIIYGVQV